MQMHEYSVDAYPTEQLFRKDSTRTETSIYLQLTEQDFSFAGYDHGSKELRERYGIRK